MPSRYWNRCFLIHLNISHGLFQNNKSYEKEEITVKELKILLEIVISFILTKNII